MTIIVKEYDTEMAICKALDIDYDDIEFFEAHDIQKNKMFVETSIGAFICESFETDTECRRCADDNKEHDFAIFMKVTKLIGE